MKKKYIQPSISVVVLDSNVITISGSPKGFSLTNGDPVDDDINNNNLSDYSLGW